MTNSILSIGHSPELLRSRSLLLRSKGFRVLEETNCSQALQLALHNRVDLLLLCHSLNRIEASLLIAELAARQRLLHVLFVLQSDFANVPSGCDSSTGSSDILLNRIADIFAATAEGHAIAPVGNGNRIESTGLQVVPDIAVTSPPGSRRILNSWKEISQYMRMGIRTVQRYELQFGLPVHRVGVKIPSAVFAFCDEIDQWLKLRPTRNIMEAARRKTGHIPLSGL